MIGHEGANTAVRHRHLGWSVVRFDPRLHGLHDVRKFLGHVMSLFRVSVHVEQTRRSEARLARVSTQLSTARVDRVLNILYARVRALVRRIAAHTAVAAVVIGTTCTRALSSARRYLAKVFFEQFCVRDVLATVP